MGRRVLIVDYNHMAHIYANSQFRLSIKVKGECGVYDKDTTIQSQTIKNIQTWSKGGYYPTALCFDRPVLARKVYMNDNFKQTIGTDKEYKGNRTSMGGAMFEGIADCERSFRAAGTSCFAEQNYEADDLVFACITRAKEQYPDLPIDVITNDADLLPLVDDTVSIWLRSLKGTYAEDKDLEKKKYIQVTPRNFEEVLQNLSAYKNFVIPYNTLLLHKLLRGDSSDNIASVKEISRQFSPKKFNNLVLTMIEDGVDMGNSFRYGKVRSSILNRVTGEKFTGNLADISKEERSHLYEKLENPKELDTMLEVMKPYVSEEVLEHLQKMYIGMNLNQAYPHKNPLIRRRSYKVADISQYNEIELQKVVGGDSLQINLKLR